MQDRPAKVAIAWRGFHAPIWRTDPRAVLLSAVTSMEIPENGLDDFEAGSLPQCATQSSLNKKPRRMSPNGAEFAEG
jgi:hypothetical protein